MSSTTLFRRLEDLGREQLSESFYMREFLYSEIAYSEGIPNMPEDPAIALEAGKGLCENVLEPIQAGLGRISVRSGYRSPQINEIGHAKKYNCASNEKNRAAHIWDLPDNDGFKGATACVVVTPFVPFYQKTGDWTALAWWIFENIPACTSMFFFPNLAAVNLRWNENPDAKRSIQSYVKNPHTGNKGALVKSGVPTIPGPYEPHYREFLNMLSG